MPRFAKGALAVDVFGADGIAVIDSGKLAVIDNQVDQTTGTVKLKAEFPNANLQLWPGQFVNVRLLVDTLTQVVVVPTAAVQRGPNGTFVYVVGDDNTVTMRPIVVQQQNETQTGDRERPVRRRDRVVTTGFAASPTAPRSTRRRRDQPARRRAPSVRAAAKGGNGRRRASRAPAHGRRAASRRRDATASGARCRAPPAGALRASRPAERTP